MKNQRNTIEARKVLTGGNSKGAATFTGCPRIFNAWAKGNDLPTDLNVLMTELQRAPVATPAWEKYYKDIQANAPTDAASREQYVKKQACTVKVCWCPRAASEPAA